MSIKITALYERLSRDDEIKYLSPRFTRRSTAPKTTTAMATPTPTDGPAPP